MTVMEIVPFDKRRSKVILDEDFTLVLYRGEISRFGIEEGKELSGDTYREILDDVLLKRARERVLFLLKSSDKTEQELRRRLKEGGYPPEAIDHAIDFFKEHRWIDDREYGRRYVEYHSERKSVRQIQYDLQKKGLDKEMIKSLLEEQPVDEDCQIRAYVRKKRIDPEKMDARERCKVMAALGRKGFSYDAVSRVLGDIYSDD
ncbi:regulatory protein RecX [Lachnospiraceae bacterium 54-53]